MNERHMMKLELESKPVERPLDDWPSLAVTLLGTETRMVQGAHGSYRVIEAGAGGHPLFLLHGIGGHADTYARNLANLAAAGFHVYAVDMPYHGLTTGHQWDEDRWIEVMADGIADLATALGHERVSIEGESLGAVVTFEFGMRHPDRAGKLVMNTGFGRVKLTQKFEPAPGGGETLRELSQQSVVNPTFENTRQRMDWLVADPARMTDEMVHLRLALYSIPEVYESMRRVYRIGKKWSFAFPYTEEDCAKFEPDALVFWTEHNPGQGPDYAEYCASLIPNSRFYCMDDAGHWPQWERPAEHDLVLTEFILGR